MIFIYTILYNLVKANKGGIKMFSKIIICLLVCILSFSSIYTESTDYEYTIFSTDENNIIDPNLLTKEQLIGQIANDYFDLKKKMKM